MHYLGTTAARLKLKGIDGELVYSGGACGLIRLNAPNLTSLQFKLKAIVNHNEAVKYPYYDTCMATFSPCLEMLGSIS